MTGPIRILVCDDSLVVRGAILRILRAEADVAVVAQARNGREAIEAVRSQRASAPIEVVILDIEMPQMNGLEALPQLIAIDPALKIVMASTLTTRGAAVTLEAIRLGAADYVPKPDAAGIFSNGSFSQELLAKIRGLARLRRLGAPSGRASARGGADALPIAVAPPANLTCMRPRMVRHRLLAVGSSTGGPQALFSFFAALGPRLRVPVVVTQHMPPSFIPMLADQIGRVGGLACSVAREGEVLRRDHVSIAPGDRHMILKNDGGALTVHLADTPPENFCRPAVDPMLRSASDACDGAVLVVMLTGMGKDGLAGASEVVRAGGEVVAQDESTSVVWGMPGAVTQAGLCRAILPLPRLAPSVLEIIGS